MCRAVGGQCSKLQPCGEGGMCAGSSVDVGLFRGEMTLAPWRCVCPDSLETLDWTHGPVCWLHSELFVTCWWNGYWVHAAVCADTVVGWLLVLQWGIS